MNKQCKHLLCKILTAMGWEAKVSALAQERLVKCFDLELRTYY